MGLTQSNQKREIPRNCNRNPGYRRQRKIIECEINDNRDEVNCVMRNENNKCIEQLLREYKECDEYPHFDQKTMELVRDIEKKICELEKNVNWDGMIQYYDDQIKKDERCDYDIMSEVNDKIDEIINNKKKRVNEITVPKKKVNKGYIDTAGLFFYGGKKKTAQKCELNGGKKKAAQKCELNGGKSKGKPAKDPQEEDTSTDYKPDEDDYNYDDEDEDEKEEENEDEDDEDNESSKSSNSNFDDNGDSFYDNTTESGETETEKTNKKKKAINGGQVNTSQFITSENDKQRYRKQNGGRNKIF